MIRKHTLKWLAVFVLASTSAAVARDEQFLHNKTLELLDVYCPDGFRIVRGVLKLGPEVNTTDFTVGIRGDDEMACVVDINTVVHEDNHAAHTFLGREALKEKFGRFSDEFYKWDYFYLKDGRFILLKKTPTFPSREIAEWIPEELRTFRFPTYIDTDNAMQSTQNEGVYGLLDEMNSYYQGTKAAFDLLPYYQKKGKSAEWRDFFYGVNSTLFGCLEFRYYILTYLFYASEKHGDVYDGLISNPGFLNAFLEIDRNVSDLISEYEVKRAELYKQFQGWGWKIKEDNIHLTLVVNGRNRQRMNFLGTFNLLTETMKDTAYSKEMIGLIERYAEGWNPEMAYDEVAKAMLETKDADTQGGKVDVNAPRTDDRASLEEIVDLSDPKADVRRPFIDWIQASVAKDEEGLLVKMQFADLSAPLAFNQPKVQDNTKEYSWSMFFDMDGDGDDDYYLGYEHFKDPQAGLKNGGIEENTQLSLWKLKRNGAEMADVRLRGKQDGNELVIDVSTSDFTSSIDENTQIHCESFFTDGTREYRDRMPD